MVVPPQDSKDGIESMEGLFRSASYFECVKGGGMYSMASGICICCGSESVTLVESDK